MRFAHLNVHSNYSFCRGASRLEELVVAARQRGMDAMALTDTNGLHGLIWFLDAAKAASLRPIVGAEIDLRALAQRAPFEVEEPGDPWLAPGRVCSLRSEHPDSNLAAGTMHGRRGIGVPASESERISVCAAAGKSLERRVRAARSPGERLADLRSWGRAVVLVKDHEGYAALCRLISALHHGGNWPPPENRAEEEEAARQKGVIERVAGHPLRRSMPAFVPATPPVPTPTLPLSPSSGNGGGEDSGISAHQKNSCGEVGDDAGLDGMDKDGAREVSASGSDHGGSRESERAMPGHPRLTRAWLAGELARLQGCVVLSADAGLLARVVEIRRQAAGEEGRVAESGRRSAEADLSAMGSVEERMGVGGDSPDIYVELRPGVARGALLRFSRASGIPPVATGGVHFADESAYPIHRLLRAIDLNTSLSRLPPEEIEAPEAVLVSPEEMARRHPDCPEAVENAARIADVCRFTLPRGTPIFPAYETMREPAGDNQARLPPSEDLHAGRPETRAGAGSGESCRAAESHRPEESRGLVLGGMTGRGDVRERWGMSHSPDEHLERDSFEGAERRYGEINEAIAERLEYELSIVREKGFAPYFLVVRDIVARAPRTCGRGSAAASLLSYALGITHVDPIRFDLFFERFLNPGRIDPPDIDVDFPWDERDDILEWTFRRYGRRRAAMVSNHVTFQARAAVREIAKVHGLTDDEIGRVTKRMPWFGGDVIETTRTHPVFKDLSFPPPWPEILHLARKIDGYPRGLSVHCGGVVIVPGAIDRYVPVQPSAKGVDVVQWEKDQCEDAGLVKIDLLGNRSLAVIRDACRSVRDSGGPDIRFETFRPIDDQPTQELVRRGDTVGVFYVESPAMRQLQAKCRVGDFEHLVIHSSIIRPAANEYIREYVRRLRGGEWTPLHPLMGELLSETYGIMVYQEDVAKIAIAMAGFDAATADGLRKILSKKNKEERLRNYRQRFFHGAGERGIDEATVTKVWDMILSFAGYSFCKPHSASYALVSFKSAYLRAHHPAEFMAAVISNGGGYYSTFAYISECRRMGLRVLLPDVNESRREYAGRTFGTGEIITTAPHAQAAAPTSAAPAGPGVEPREPGRSRLDAPRPRGVVRVGLMQLKGFPDAAIDTILDERERGGQFGSFEDFLARCGEGIGPAAIRILIRSGAFDSLLGSAQGEQEEERGSEWKPAGGGLGSMRANGAGEARPAFRGDLFWHLAAWERRRGKGGLRGERSLLPPPEAGPLPRSGPYDERTTLEQEIDALGFLISRHPLTLFRRLIEAVKPVRGCDLGKHVGRGVRVVGWYVTGKTVQTRRGEPMEFLSFEDTTALYETTFFPRVYARFCHMMTKVRPYLLTGRVEEDFGAISLNVSDVRFLDSGAPFREDVPVAAPHIGGTSPRSEAWTRRA